jgi:lipopolysaccharide export LptBFGC system permease protein LptF
MNILRRYTLREMYAAFLMTLSLFTFIFLTGTIVKMVDTVLNKGIGLFDMLKILGLSIPEVFSFTLPTSALAAVVLALGSFSQNNELRAMKAVGINPLTIMVPILLVAFLLSVFAVVFNDRVVSEARFAKRKLIKKVLFKNPSSIFEPNQFIKDFKGYIFHVKGVNGNRLEQVIVYQPEEGQPTRTIIAERGEITTSPDGEELIVKIIERVGSSIAVGINPSGNSKSATVSPISKFSIPVIAHISPVFTSFTGFLPKPSKVKSSFTFDLIIFPSRFTIETCWDDRIFPLKILPTAILPVKEE